MKAIPSLICFALTAVTLSAAEGENDYQRVLEAKYQSSIERLKVIHYSDTTKILSFDFELSGDKSWWGGFNVVETGMDGSLVYWHDIPQPPIESGIENIRVVELSGRRYLEVIACSHQGNGSLYLYELRGGALHLLVNCRAMTNLTSMHFWPTVARIAYQDVDEDGDQDLVVNASCLKGRIIDASRNVIGKYQRIFHYKDGEFVEQISQRDGAPFLMD